MTCSQGQSQHRMSDKSWQRSYTHISTRVWWNLCSRDFPEILPVGLMFWSRKKCQHWFPPGKSRSADRMTDLGKRQHSNNSLWEEKRNMGHWHLDHGSDEDLSLNFNKFPWAIILVSSHFVEQHCPEAPQHTSDFPKVICVYVYTIFY